MYIIDTPTEVYLSPIHMNKQNSAVDRSHDILPDSIYITFNAPAVNEYHRGILITDNFRASIDPPSGTLYHAVDPEGPETWQLEQRQVNNIKASKSLALIYRIAQFAGTPDDIAAQTQHIETILRRVKFVGSAERISKLGSRGVTDGYSCVLWTEDALVALVENLPRSTFLSHLNFSTRKGMARADAIVAEANLARQLAGPVEAELMVGKHIPGKFEVYN